MSSTAATAGVSPQTTDLQTAQLAIYAVLCLPILFILFKHGRVGFLGWLYLFAFATLRVVGGALAKSKGPTDSSAALISNIGLSPLLLAMSGVLHEARHYRNLGTTSRIEAVLVFLYHLLVTTGLALVASGSSAFSATSTSTSNTSNQLGLVKGGIITLLLAWVAVTVWTFFSLLPSQARREGGASYIEGTKLLYAVLFTVPFVGVRMLYSVISILAPSKELNPVNGAFGLRVGLSFIPELIAALIFIAVGIVTRDIVRRTREGEHRSRGKHGSGSSGMPMGSV